MMKCSALWILTVTLCVHAHAGEKDVWDGSYTPLRGQYLVYSGELGEQAAPTKTERKAALMIEGTLAKEMFDSASSDLKDACGTLSGLRIRQKGDLRCTFDKDARSSPYTCRIGVNLRTGKSIGGSIC